MLTGLGIVLLGILFLVWFEIKGKDDE